MANRTLTFVIEQELYEIIFQRSKQNRRSVSQEVCYLLEAGLATGNENIRDLMRLIYRIDEKPTLEAEG